MKNINSKIEGYNSLNRMKLMMNYNSTQTLNENENRLFEKINKQDFVFSDLGSPDSRYVIFFDELYDTKNLTNLGNIWENLGNLKLFLEYSFKKSNKISEQIKESYLIKLDSILLTESKNTNQLSLLKNNCKLLLSEGNWVSDFASYVGQSAKDLVTGTTELVGSAVKGTGQIISAGLKGDFKKIWEILKGGVLYFAKWLRRFMYNPIGSILDALLILSGVGKAAQWIPWAIIVALDIYEISQNEFEFKLPNTPMGTAFRWLMIGGDILGLVTAGAAALAYRKTVIQPIRKNLLNATPEAAGQFLAKPENAVIKQTIESLMANAGKVPGFLQKAVDLLKPRLPKIANWLSQQLQKASNFINGLISSLKLLGTKKGLTVAGVQTGIDYGMQKGMDFVTGVGQQLVSTESQPTTEPIINQTPETKNYLDNIRKNYS